MSTRWVSLWMSSNELVASALTHFWCLAAVKSTATNQPVAKTRIYYFHWCFVLLRHMIYSEELTGSWLGICAGAQGWKFASLSETLFHCYTFAPGSNSAKTSSKEGYRCVLHTCVLMLVVVDAMKAANRNTRMAGLIFLLGFACFWNSVLAILKSNLV